MLQSLIAFLDRTLAHVKVGSLWFARAGGVLILLTVALVTVEVVSRAVIGRSPVHATELTGYIMAISASWSFAYTLICKAHIRIDALYLTFPAKVRALLDLIALTALAMFSLLIVDAVFSVVSDSYNRGSTANTPLSTPLWIPQVLWLVGLIWFGIATSLFCLRALTGLLDKDISGIQKFAGTPTLDEQIEEETREANS